MGPQACRGESGRGGNGARQKPEARDIAKAKREENGWRELREKRRGMMTLYVDLADRARSDASNAAGGEGSHEAAKPEGVIHRNCVNLV